MAGIFLRSKLSNVLKTSRSLRASFSTQKSKAFDCTLPHVLTPDCILKTDPTGEVTNFFPKNHQPQATDPVLSQFLQDLVVPYTQLVTSIMPSIMPLVGVVALNHMLITGLLVYSNHNHSKGLLSKKVTDVQFLYSKYRNKLKLFLAGICFVSFVVPFLFSYFKFN